MSTRSYNSKKMCWLLPSIGVLLSAQTYDALPRIVRQGETLRIRGAEGAVKASLGSRTIRLFPQPEGGSLGLMPVPVEQAPGEYKAEFLDQNGSILRTTSITVQNAHFASQNIVIGKAISQLKPSPGESETVKAFRNAVSDVRYWAEPLEAPLPGCMTSPFGVKRFHNKKPTGDYHGGVDQRGEAGSPIHAVADGVVKIVRQYNLHGGTVGIDHGQGLESMYLHMSNFAASEGLVVRKGAVIGYVGSTGRSTAPHLHWSLYANGVPVNPAQWLKLQPCAVESKARKPRKGRRRPVA